MFNLHPKDATILSLSNLQDATPLSSLHPRQDATVLLLTNLQIRPGREKSKFTLLSIINYLTSNTKRNQVAPMFNPHPKDTTILLLSNLQDATVLLLPNLHPKQNATVLLLTNLQIRLGREKFIPLSKLHLKEIRHRKEEEKITLLPNPHPTQEATVFSPHPKQEVTISLVSNLPPKTVDKVTSSKEITVTPCHSPKVTARVLLLPPKDKTILQNKITRKVTLLLNHFPRKRKITVRVLSLAAPPNKITTKVTLLLYLKTEANQLNENRRQKKSISLH